MGRLMTAGMAWWWAKKPMRGKIFSGPASISAPIMHAPAVPARAFPLLFSNCPPIVPCCHTPLRAGPWPMLGGSDSFLDCPPIVETGPSKTLKLGPPPSTIFPCSLIPVLHFLDSPVHLKAIRIRDPTATTTTTAPHLPTNCPPCPTASRPTAMDPRIKLTPLPSAI